MRMLGELEITFQHWKAKPAELSEENIDPRRHPERRGHRFPPEVSHRCSFDPWRLDVCPNFGRSVLGCIEADFCNERLMLQHFFKIYKIVHFCTAPNSTFSASRTILQMIGEFFRFKKDVANILPKSVVSH